MRLAAKWARDHPFALVESDGHGTLRFQIDETRPALDHLPGGMLFEESGGDNRFLGAELSRLNLLTEPKGVSPAGPGYS